MDSDVLLDINSKSIFEIKCKPISKRKVSMRNEPEIDSE